MLPGYFSRYKVALPFFFVFALFQNLTSLYPYRVNNRRRRRCVMGFPIKSLPKGFFFLSHTTSRGRGEEGRGDSLILIEELFFLESLVSMETIVGDIVPLEAEGCDLPLSRE
jgi:hypothetical protein